MAQRHWHCPIARAHIAWLALSPLRNHTDCYIRYTVIPHIVDKSKLQPTCYSYSMHAAAASNKATVGLLLVGAAVWAHATTTQASGTELGIAKTALVPTHERKAHRCAPASDVAGRPARLLPSILLIGERKCGTSSLARYLAMHSHVLPPETISRSATNEPECICSALPPCRRFAIVHELV